MLESTVSFAFDLQLYQAASASASASYDMTSNQRYTFAIYSSMLSNSIRILSIDVCHSRYLSSPIVHEYLTHPSPWSSSPPPKTIGKSIKSFAKALCQLILQSIIKKGFLGFLPLFSQTPTSSHTTACLNIKSSNTP